MFKTMHIPFKIAKVSDLKQLWIKQSLHKSMAQFLYFCFFKCSIYVNDVVFD